VTQLGRPYRLPHLLERVNGVLQIGHPEAARDTVGPLDLPAGDGVKCRAAPRREPREFCSLMTATVGYVPGGRIVGVSKIPRLVHHYARGLQNQERPVQQVADCLEDTLQPKGVGVILHARHLCMGMRGVQIAGTVTTTSALRGVFLDDARCRREFLDFDAKSG
jgi:hypothetical protein